MVDSLKDKQQQNITRILIVGGVAGGASCAARARRLSEKAEIIVFERGPHVSFASCGLPYYMGDVITEEDKLLIATPELFKQRFNIAVRTRHEVISIDKDNQEIEIKNLDNSEVYSERYDALVLSPGSVPIKPPIPGIDLPGIVGLKTIQDARDMREMLAGGNVKSAVVVGGGAVGLECLENLVNRGIKVTLIDMLPQVLPSLDPEQAAVVHSHLRDKGVKLVLGNQVAGFEKGQGKNEIVVITRSGDRYTCNMVLLSIGARPETTLAKQAGLQIGNLGGIRVDEHMRTSDHHIWAVGDAVEVKDYITGAWKIVPLGGPANRQGRIAADVIMGRNSRFRGIQGTFVCRVFDLVVAQTGVSEKTLLASPEGIKYEKVYLHPGNHAGYYPGAIPIHMKLIFSGEDGKILGAQAVGGEGAERRIDVISMAIQKRSTVFDLEEAELCYAPQFGSANDPVNMAGMVAANAQRQDSPVCHWKEVVDSKAFLLDVREPHEFARGHVEGAVNIPLPTIRDRLGELPRDGEILVYCGVGQRSYYATRILRLNGFPACNISGGWTTYDILEKS